MIVKALYGENNDELDLLNQRWYSTSLGFRNQLSDLLTTDVQSFTSSQVQMVGQIEGDASGPFVEQFDGNFTLSSEGFGFDGFVRKETSLRTTSEKIAFARYEIIHDEPYQILSALFEGETWESLLDGDDEIIGGQHSDILLGFSGNDLFIPNGGSDLIVGGLGVDTVQLSSDSLERVLGGRDSWVEQVSSLDNPFESVDRVFEGRLLTVDGDQLLLVDIERIRVGDELWALDFDKMGNGYKAASLIASCFGSNSIDEYMGTVLALLDQGMTQRQIADIAVELQLIEEEIGLGNADFVNHIYSNVTGVEANALVIGVYADQLEKGEASRSDLMLIGANSAAIDSQLDLDKWMTEGMLINGYL